jgi:sRNA-binding regulator protein Hfq
MAAACESNKRFHVCPVALIRARDVRPHVIPLGWWRKIITVNRKLIRTTLAEIKGKGREVSHQKERPNGSAPRGPSSDRGSDAPRASVSQSQPSVQVRKRVPPPIETNAEIFYYKKQIDAHTPMVIVLQDGEEIEGTIEWYDKGALKVNRKSAPNLLVLKHNIKYMYKVEDREAT